jgi:hypothetical protein
MNGQTYIVYTKLSDGASRIIKITASGYTTSAASEGRQVCFNDNGKVVAIFNMSELIGFAQEDHIVH